MQCVLETLGAGHGGRVQLTKEYHRALDASVAKNFPDNGIIACMSHNTDALYCSKQTAVVRASDDFFPREAVSHTIHIAAVAYADVNGRFKLDGLKLGRKYHVICNPPGFGRALKVFASAEIDLDVNVSARVLDIDLDVDLDLNLSAMAKIRGDILPGISLDGCDYVALVRQLSCGIGCNKWFIVDHVTAKVDVNESFEFKALAKGNYAVQSKRLLCSSDHGCKWSTLWVSAAVDLDLSLNLNAILGIRL